jgi:hypothetical protein
VEGLTLFKTKKKKNTVVRGGAGNSKAPALTTTDRTRGVPLGTRAHKEGAVEMIGEWSSQPGRKQQKNNKRKHRARKKKKT